MPGWGLTVLLPQAIGIRRAREIHEAAEAENRGFTDEEQQNYDAAMDDAADLMERIERAQRQEALERANTDLDALRAEQANQAPTPA